MTKAKNPAPPAGNAAESESLAGVMGFFFTKMMQQTDDMLPAKVISYNPTTNRAKVQPLIAFVTTTGEILQRSTVGSVPVLQLSGGGFALVFPINPGDLGWIKSNDRDISTFKQSLAPSAPPTQRKKSFSDAVFIPDAMFRGVSRADSAGVCLQSLDGTAAVIVKNGKVIVRAPEIEYTAGTKITMTSPEIFFDSTNCNMGGVRFNTHHHTGVQPGAGQTGGPVNP